MMETVSQTRVGQSFLTVIQINPILSFFADDPDDDGDGLLDGEEDDDGDGVVNAKDADDDNDGELQIRTFEKNLIIISGILDVNDEL